MKTMTTRKKENVRNPMDACNTVGAELELIFRLHGIEDGARRMGLGNLAGKETLSPLQMEKACRILDRGEEFKLFLSRFQEEYMADKERAAVAYAKARKNFSRLKEMAFLLKDEFTSGVDVLDDILDFFGVDSEDEIFSESDKVAALFRRQKTASVNPVNLKAWLRRGELDFAKLSLPEYDERALLAWIDGREWDRNIENPEYFRQLPSVLSSFGVALVLVPYVPNTVYGAVRWLDGHPLIQISDRGRDLATCWFTLFHELGHVIRHRNKEIYEVTLNESSESKNRMEAEANKFANYYLFNGDDLRKAVFANAHSNTTMMADVLARQYNVHPLFASYWLIRAQYHPTMQRRRHIDFGMDYR